MNAARVLALAMALLLGGDIDLGAQSSTARPHHRLDRSQAEVMLQFLERASEGPIDDDDVSAVMAAPATALVIAQMNLMRTVTEAQYAAVLRGVRAQEAPRIEPADDSERAIRGVRGLADNVWPVLRWGSSHTALLRERLRQIDKLDVYDMARERALAFLPAPADVSAQVFLVMGGRAGAAALAGDRIYVDILLLSFLDDLGRRPYDPETDLFDFIAHEMHHLGYAELLAEQRASLELDGRELLAYGLLSAVVSEGSATYLISGHRDMGRALASDSGVSQLAGRGDELLGDCEHVLRALRTGEIGDQAQYDQATGFLLGSGAHLAGALMLSRIDGHGGLEAVMTVLADPRRLLIEYNTAAGDKGPNDGRHTFDPRLAALTARLGRESRGSRGRPTPATGPAP